MNQKTHRHSLGRTAVLCAGVIGAFFAVFAAAHVVFASPSANPPSGSGVISVSGSNVGIGITNPTIPLAIGGVGTGFYGNASTLNAYSGSNLVATFLSSGNVGIGTSAPAYKLDVTGNANVSGSLTVGAFTATLSSANISAGTFGSNTGGGNYTFPGSVTWGNGSSLSSDGNGAIELGQNAGSGNMPFIDFHYGVGSTQDYNVRVMNSGNNIFTISTASTGNVFTVNGSNVGIGTMTPGSLLDVSGAGATVMVHGTYNANLALIPNGTGALSYYISATGNGATQGAGKLIFNNGSADIMTISGGNVGIGMTAPSYKLDVAGQIRSSSGGYVFPDGTTQTTAASGGGWYDGWITNPGYDANTIAASKSGFTYSNNAPYGGPVVRFNAGGYDLELNAPYGGGSALSFRTRNGDNGTWNSWYSTVNTSNFSSQTLSAGNVSAGTFGSGTGGGNYAFSSNVGIGTTAPGYSLEVAGNTSIGGKAFVTGNSNEIWTQPQVNGNAALYINYRGYADAQTQFRDLNISNGKGGNIAFFQGSTGNVGIGMLSPGYRLDVAGQIRSSSGGYVFPDGTTQTTAAFGSSVINAGNVSAGTFGSNTGGGNYNFPASVAANSGVFMVNAYGQGQIVLNSNGTYYGNISNPSAQVWSLGYSSGGTAIGTSVLSWNSSGNVGIGTTAPAMALDVNGSINSNSYVYSNELYSRDNLYLGYLGDWMSNRLGQDVRSGAAVTFGSINMNAGGSFSYWGGDQNFRTWMSLDGTYYYGAVKDYAVHFVMDGEDSGRGWTWGANGQRPNMSLDVNGNLTLAGKLTVSTIDPLYTINGKNYATYVSGMTGQKEETAGTLELGKGKDGKYGYSIDFSGLSQGSDLWLFGKATDIKDGMDGLTIGLTPAFDGNAWYEKIPAKHLLVIHATATDNSAPTIEVSYRLTAPRFDAAKWTNAAPENETTTKGFIIND